MNEPTDLDIRIAALQQEHISHVGQMSARAALLASELASTKARLEAAEDRVAELSAPLQVLADPVGEAVSA